MSYSFASASFKDLGRNLYLRKEAAVPAGTATAASNSDPSNILAGKDASGECQLWDWFDTDGNLVLDEEAVGLGGYRLTLTVLSSEVLALQADDDGGEEADLLQSWTPRFAYGR